MGRLMRCDFDMIPELCRELGLSAVARSSNEVAIELEKGVALVFINASGRRTPSLASRMVHGSLRERSLVHRDYVDEFRYMEEGEEIRIHRVQVRNAALEQPRPNKPMQTDSPSGRH